MPSLAQWMLITTLLAADSAKHIARIWRKKNKHKCLASDAIE